MNDKLNFIKRRIFEKVSKHLSNKEMTLIIGPRQVGKTVLLKQLKEFLILEKKVLAENIYNFNLDIINDKEALNNQADFIKFVRQRSHNNKIYVFIDEAQKIENAGIFLKGIYDSDLNVKFILTGSSTLEIKAKIQESLTGRKRIFHMLPFAFLEILQNKNQQLYNLINKGEKISQKDKREASETFTDYCLYGGYPQVVLADDIYEKQAYLQEIFTSYIEKDIIGFLRVENESNFVKLVKIMSAQIGQLVNVGEVSALVNTDRYTIDRYLSSLEKTFISYRLKPYYENARQEIVKMEKTYFVDMGLRNSSLDDFREPFSSRKDKCELMENAVLKELLVLKYENNFSLRFWRTKQKAEVDFIIERGVNVTPIEVKTYLKNNNIGASLAGFIARYNPKKALVINLSYQGIRIVGETEVRFVLPYELKSNIE